MNPVSSFTGLGCYSLSGDLIIRKKCEAIASHDAYLFAENG
jgi:hypothetical protein